MDIKSYYRMEIMLENDKREALTDFEDIKKLTPILTFDFGISFDEKTDDVSFKNLTFSKEVDEKTICILNMSQDEQPKHVRLYIVKKENEKDPTIIRHDFGNARISDVNVYQGSSSSCETSVINYTYKTSTYKINGEMRTFTHDLKNNK